MGVIAKKAEDRGDGGVSEEVARSAMKKKWMDETRGCEAFAEMFVKMFIC